GMKLYDELASWWPAFSEPASYRSEASHFIRVLRKATKPAPRAVLELGSGGGNSAYYFKSHFQMTLVDMSPRMLKVSRRLNPECGAVGFLQGVVDPNPADTTYVVDFAVMIRDKRGRARVVHDRHVQGLFPRARWLRLLRDAGFKARTVVDRRVRDALLGRRPE